MSFRLVLAVALLLSACASPSEAPRSPAGASDLAARQITAQGQFEVTVLRRDRLYERQLCWAEAQSRNANWTGLWWSSQQADAITCALAPRRDNVVEAPLMDSLACSGALCEQLPLRLATSGTRSVAIHARPDETSRTIGEVSPGEQVTVVDRMDIYTFTHRGVVRRATNSLAVGQIVFPVVRYGDEPFPWRATPPGPDEPTYTVRTAPYGLIEIVPADRDQPYVEWTPLAPLRGNTSWVLLEDSEGVRGWAAHAALGIDFYEFDENE